MKKIIASIILSIFLWLPGSVQGAISCDGNDYADFDPSGGNFVLPDADWALGMWLLIDEEGGTDGDYALSWGAFSGTDSIQIGYDKTNNAIFVEMEDGAGADVISFKGTTDPASSFGTWFHFLLERDGSTVTMYWDGTSDGSDTNASFDDVDRSTNLDICRRTDGSSTRYWLGDVDEFFKIDRKTTSLERAALAKGTRPSVLFAGELKYYYPFDQGALGDLSGNAVTGTNFGTVEGFHAPVGPLVPMN